MAIGLRAAGCEPEVPDPEAGWEEGAESDEAHGHCHQRGQRYIQVSAEHRPRGWTVMLEETPWPSVPLICFPSDGHGVRESTYTAGAEGVLNARGSPSCSEVISDFCFHVVLKLKLVTRG